MLCLITVEKVTYLHLLFLMFITVPLEYLKVTNIVLIAGLSIFFCLNESKIKKSLILCTAAFATYYGLQNLNELLELGYKDQLSLRMFEINSMMFLIVYNQVSKKTSKKSWR